MLIDYVYNVYPNFSFPEKYYELLSSKDVKFGEWYIMTEEQVASRLDGLRRRYSKRKIVPFARRYDNDDVACFDVEHNGEILIIHDFASAGYEQRGAFSTLESWLAEVLQQANDQDEA